MNIYIYIHIYIYTYTYIYIYIYIHMHIYGEALKLQEFDDGSFENTRFCHEHIYA